MHLVGRLCYEIALASRARTHKLRSFGSRWLMSALPQTADIRRVGRDVRFVPIADIPCAGRGEIDLRTDAADAMRITGNDVRNGSEFKFTTKPDNKHFHLCWILPDEVKVTKRASE